jgi:5'-nucleotidase
MRGRHLVARRTPFVAVLAAMIGALTFAATSPAGAAKKPQPTITVLVTDDDGVGAPAIDAVVEALRQQKRTKVVVVAPATNQSGTGSKTTPGGATGGPATTASGYEATAVQGFPADSVDYALDVLKLTPTVVISGSNLGQNLGPITEVSGTVGAARQAARRGIPALAVSNGLGDAPDYATAGKLAVEWLNEHRKALAKRKPSTTPLTEIDSINVPNCPNGPRGLYTTVLAPEGTTEPLITAAVNCASTLTSFASDAQAFNNGYATITKVGVPQATG